MRGNCKLSVRQLTLGGEDHSGAENEESKEQLHCYYESVLDEIEMSLPCPTS